MWPRPPVPLLVHWDLRIPSSLVIGERGNHPSRPHSSVAGVLLTQDWLARLSVTGGEMRNGWVYTSEDEACVVKRYRNADRGSVRFELQGLVNRIVLHPDSA